ncbi:gas vesicle protein [Dactylosporangium sp. NPDC000555]|uniref:gas vesicle protein n=1 Tax=Dactylosporangium sp. NPDC000555 TaxID=3154260 RepID=UPI00332C71C2
MSIARQPSSIVGQQPGGAAVSGHEPANLGDILERVLDRGIVIVGDIRVSLLDIELLTLKLRLVIASVDTARQMGIDWWERDPWLSSRSREAQLEAGAERHGELEPGERRREELGPGDRRREEPETGEAGVSERRPRRYAAGRDDHD